MSNGYGVDIYGLAFYGYSQPQDYSVTPFTASQVDYNEIKLQWSPPNTTAWKYLQLVRSTYGYPSTAQDGTLLQQITIGSMVKTYDDTGLTAGTIYYYAMFITIEAPTWSNVTAYAVNAQVLYNGMYWNNLVSGNTNHTPVAGSSFWSPSTYIPTWYPAGYAATLALGNSGYGTLLYNRTPQPYKIVTSDTLGNTSIDNPSLQRYLNVIGFGLSNLKNTYDSYLNLNNPDKVSATSLDILGQQLGIFTDYMSTPQRRRERIKNASANYRLKGEPQSIHNLIADLSGWDSSSTYGPNLLNSGDQSAFVHPSYDMWNANSTYFVNQFIQYNGYNYKNLVQASGTAEAPTGLATSNTWWQVQLQTLDTTTLSNPSTGLFSTWQIVPNGNVTTLQGVLTGLPHPTDTSINNWNALAYTQTTNIGFGYSDVFSVSPLNTPNYSGSTNYVINNYVLNTADNYYYIALEPNGPGTTVVAPGTNNQVWKAIYYTTSDLPNNIKDGIPIPQTPAWNNSTTYQVGMQVEYLGVVYYAANININYAPTGNYYSNLNWTFLQPAEFAYTASAWMGSIATGSGPFQAACSVNFYDGTGKQLTTTLGAPVGGGPGSLGLGSISRFVYDYADLNGTTDASLLNYFGPTAAWSATPSTTGLWKSSYGMAYVDPTLAGTTLYEYILVTGSFQSIVRLGLTFTTDYVDTTHKTHGIIFGFQDASNFYYTTRKTLYRVVAGVESSLATWTRLVNGDRMVIDVNSANIIVYKYARDGQGTLTTLATVTNNITGSVESGIIHKYSSSGAV